MRYAAVLMVVSSLMVSCTANKHEDNSSAAKDPLDKLGWRLGCQAWTFRKLSLFVHSCSVIKACARPNLSLVSLISLMQVSIFYSLFPTPYSLLSRLPTRFLLRFF